MCSLPTMKFRAPAAPGLACGPGGGVGFAVLSRDGPLSFSLWTYRVRMIKNCRVEAAISLMTFRAAPGAALKLRSTRLRSTNGVAGVPPGCAPGPLGPTVGDGIGVDDGPPSLGKGVRRSEVKLATFASSKIFMSIWILEMFC